MEIFTHTLCRTFIRTRISNDNRPLCDEKKEYEKKYINQHTKIFREIFFESSSFHLPETHVELSLTHNEFYFSRM